MMHTMRSSASTNNLANGTNWNYKATSDKPHRAKAKDQAEAHKHTHARLTEPAAARKPNLTEPQRLQPQRRASVAIERRCQRYGKRQKMEDSYLTFHPDPDAGWDKSARCGSCLQLGLPGALPCATHRPTHANAGIRIGEASNPGPDSKKKGKGKGKGRAKNGKTAARKRRIEDKLAEGIANHPVAEDEPPAFIPIVIHILSDLPTLGLVGWSGGGLVTDRGNHHYHSHRGTPVRAQTLQDTPRSLINFKEVEPGVYEQLPPLEAFDNEPPSVTPTEAFMRITTHPITINGKVYFGEDRIILRSLLEKFAKTFPNPVISDCNINAFTALANRDFSSLPIGVIAHTIHLYVIQCYQRQQAARDELVTTIKNATIPEKGLRSYFNPLGVEDRPTMQSLGVDYQVDGFHRMEGVDDPLPQILEENGNFSIVAKKGYTPFVEGPGHIAGEFHTATNVAPRIHYTIGMGIRGKKDFHVLDRSGNNVVKALSRMYKARDSEGELRANQLALLRVGDLDRPLLKETTNSPVQTISQVFRKAIDVSPQPLPDEDPPTNMVRLVLHPFFLGMERTVAYWEWAVRFVGLALFLYCAFAARAWYVGLTTVLFCGVGSMVPTKRIFPKARLYQLWFREIVLGLGHTYDAPLTDDVEAKFKVELAKPRKHGRLFVSYGQSILQAGWIFDSIKKAFCVSHDIGEIARKYLPRLADSIPEARAIIYKSLDESEDLTDIIRADGLTARIFSDDMSLTYNYDGVSCSFDADISSCDAGNGSAMFYFLGLIFRLYGYGEFFAHQMKRLRAIITVRNPSSRDEYVKIRPTTLFQGSGCPETTIVNDVASFCIVTAFVVFIAYYDQQYLSIAPGLSFSGGDEDTRSRILQRAARAVGHKVTIAWRHNNAGLQFLKYSPLTSSTGELVNTRNLGAILRNLGRVEGDLSAIMLGLSRAKFRAMKPAERFERYISGVVLGLKNEPQHCITIALRARFCSDSAPIVHHHEDTLLGTDRSHHIIPVTSLQERYGGEDHEWDHLAEAITNLKYGDQKFSNLLDKIMEVDYDL